TKSLSRIVLAFDRHVEAIHYNNERNGSVNLPGYDGVVRSPTTNVFGIAAKRLVEAARGRGENWLTQDVHMLRDFEAALEAVRTSERPLIDVVAVIDVARSSLQKSEE